MEAAALTENWVVSPFVAFRSAKGRSFAPRKATNQQSEALPKIASTAIRRVPCFGTPKHAFEYQSMAPSTKGNKSLCNGPQTQDGVASHLAEWSPFDPRKATNGDTTQEGIDRYPLAE